MGITFSVLAGFFVIIVVVLHISRKYEQKVSFSNYAVGERSFKSWFVTMAYLNSWFPGAIFMAYLAPAVTLGVLNLFTVTYSVFGVLTMYFIARPVWRWGKSFDLRTQSDLLALRYSSRGIKVLTSIISTIALFPWLVLGLQCMGAIVQWASLNHLSLQASIFIGVAVIAIRQIWTVQMGMRGLIITDMVQGIVAYIGGSIICIGLIVFYFWDRNGLAALPDANFSLPGFDSVVGGWYYFGIVASGIVGSLCWPFIFTRIYTARSVRAVKKGVVQTMSIGLVFCGLLMFVGMMMGADKDLVAIPGEAWFALNLKAGGIWLLAAACLVVLGATMGMVDGVIQAMGTQVANDVVGVMRPLKDKQEIVVSKVAMTVFVVLGLFVAFQTYEWANLINLGFLAYQAIIQLAVPLFAGLFWRRGSRVAAMASLLVGSAVALALTIPYFEAAGAVPWLDGMGSGMVALAVNAVVYVVCSYVFPNSKEEQGHIDGLFEEARAFVSPQQPAAGRDDLESPVPAME